MFPASRQGTGPAGGRILVSRGELPDVSPKAGASLANGGDHDPAKTHSALLGGDCGDGRHDPAFHRGALEPRICRRHL